MSLKLVEGHGGWAIQASGTGKDLAWLDKSKYSRSDVTILFEIMDEVWEDGKESGKALGSDSSYEEGYREGWRDFEGDQAPAFAGLE